MKKTLLIIALLSIFISKKAFNQCFSIPSSCGYTVNLEVIPTTIVPNQTNCTFGYNYNVTFNYKVTVTGVNTCYDGQIGLQPIIVCNNQNNGFYSILINAPKVGEATKTSIYQGTLTTTSNPYLGSSDCATATPASLGCNKLELQFYGPGLANPSACTIKNLPIDLISFNTKNIENSVILNWNTGNYQNFSHFEIQKGGNAIEFETIAKVEINNSNYYLKVDKMPIIGLNYYRLKMVDLDGSFKYSKIISTHYDKNEIYLSIENPIETNYIILSTNQQNPKIQLFNNLGLKMNVMVQKESDNKYIINTKSMNSGIYFLMLNNNNNNNKLITKKIIIR